MAVHDRDYMRKGRPLFGGGDGRWSAATWVVALGAVVPVAAEVAARWFTEPLVTRLWLTWDGLLAGRWWTVLTHPFVDRLDWGWIVGLVVTWFLVRLAEDDLGRLRTCVFLATVAVVGSVVHAAAFAGDVGWKLGGQAAMGLSALGTACVVFAAVRRPRLPVHLIFFAVPLWLVATLWAGSHLAPLVLRAWHPSDVWTQVGAVFWGLAAGRLGLVPDPGAWSARRAQAQDRERDRRRIEAEVDVRRRVDALLEKIQAEGIQSLTDAEREFLKDASKRYR